MRLTTPLLAGLSLLVACPAPVSAPSRVTLRRVGGTTFELIPSPGQLPYCLAFTHSTRGVSRQLTMSSKNVSYDCPVGLAVGGHPYRTPLDEGPTRVLVLFTDQKVNAASVAQQLLEHDEPRQLTAMDLRLPGNAALEAIDFVPEADTEATVGEVLGGGDAGPR